MIDLNKIVETLDMHRPLWDQTKSLNRVVRSRLTTIQEVCRTEKQKWGLVHMLRNEVYELQLTCDELIAAIDAELDQ